jgi:hypothetical protein
VASSDDHHQGREGHVQDKNLEKIMLEDCRPFDDNRYVKMFLNEYVPYWCMGEKIMSLREVTVIK